MVIFLTVLKVIGWVLLAIICLLALLVGLVLFVPVQYRFAGTFDRETGPDGEGRVAWLFHLLRFCVSVKERRVSAELWILWFRIKLYPTDKPDGFDESVDRDKVGFDESADRDKPDGFDEISDKDRPKHRGDIKERDGAGGFGENAGGVDGSGETAVQGNFADRDKPDEAGNTDEKERGRFFSKLFHIKSTIQGMAERIRGMLKNIRKLIRRLQKGWNDERNRLAARHLKQEFIRLWRYIRPKKISLGLHFSAGSPDYTGMILGVIAVCASGCGAIVEGSRNCWQVEPDFEEEQPYADGQADIRGRIRACHIIAGLLRILLDKNCRRMGRFIAGLSLH